MNNLFKTYFETNKDYAFFELLEFLEDFDITCYGIHLAPKKLIKLKHELMKRGLSVEELQK
jgi:hypothetical protein